MTPDQLEDVRADIYAEPWKDPQLFPDLLHKAITELGVLATREVDPSTCACFDGGSTWHDGHMVREYHLEPNPECPVHFGPEAWAARLLVAMQVRARSGVPFGEPAYGDLGPTNPKEA